MKLNHLLSGHWDGLQAATLQLLSPLLHATVQKELVFISSASLRIPMALGKEPLSSLVYRGVCGPGGLTGSCGTLVLKGKGSRWGKGVGEGGDFAFVESCPPGTSQDSLDTQTCGMLLQQFLLTGEATKAPGTQEVRWGPQAPDYWDRALTSAAQCGPERVILLAFCLAL